MRYPGLLCLGKFIIYISCSGLIIQLHLNYICVFINMFVNHIMVSSLIHFCILYYLIVAYNSSWVFCPISLLCMGYSSTILSLHSQLYWYVCECYIYVYCDMFIYFIKYAPWLYYILGRFSRIFPIYDLLCHFRHTCWPTFTKLD